MSILDQLCDGDAALRLYSVGDAEELHVLENMRVEKGTASLLFSGLCLATMAFVAVVVTVWDAIRPAVR